MTGLARASVGAAVFALVVTGVVPASADRRRGARGARARRAAPRAESAERYRRASERWHAPVRTPAGFRSDPTAAVRLRTIHGGREVELRPLSNGALPIETVARAEEVLSDPRTGVRRMVDRRLLELVYRTARHFGVPLVHVVSCVRAPRGQSRSNHHVGRAMDFVLPGISDERVAEFARGFGFVGVGLYPRSGFVHLDVRDRSYFWVDYSGPGQPSRGRQILAELAERMDRRARAGGLTPSEGSAVLALMPDAPLLDPDAPEVFEVATDSDVVDPVADPFEGPSDAPVEVASAAPVDDAQGEPEPLTVATADETPDAAEEPIVEVPRAARSRRVRWARRRAPRSRR